MTFFLLSLPNWQAPPAHLRTLIYLGALAAALWVMSQARRSFWLLSLLALPGTFCHEGCHWAVGKVLNGQPVHFTVIPKREGHGYVLGSVGFANLRWYNAFFVGMAPLFLLPAAYLLFLWRLGARPALGWPEATMVFLLASLVFGSIPSAQDLRIAGRWPLGWFLLAGGLLGVWWSHSHRPHLRPATSSASRAVRKAIKGQVRLAPPARAIPDQGATSGE